MIEQPFPVPMDELIAHESFIRSLAKGLLFDDSQVDDVVQQAWMAAIQAPPSRITNLRAWLSTVTRHQVLKMRQKERRLLAREKCSAKPEAIESVAGFLEKESLRREVVDAVMGLEEPYRATILLRYFESLPPRVIAKRANVPVATVYSRIKRALEMLRARLDEKHGGDRRAWALGLVPLAAQGAKVVSMATVGLLAAGVILFSGLTTFFILPSSKEDLLEKKHNDLALATPMVLATRDVFTTTESGNTHEGFGAERSEVKPLQDDDAETSLAEEDWVLRGRIVDHLGKPIPALLSWPWSWAEGYGVPYFNLEAVNESKESSQRRNRIEMNQELGAEIVFHNDGTEEVTIASDGVVAKVQLDIESQDPQRWEKVSAMSRRSMTSALTTIIGTGFVVGSILDYNEADGSFSVVIPKRLASSLFSVRWASAGVEYKSPLLRYGDTSLATIVVDMEKVRSHWGFWECVTYEKGSQNPVEVQEPRLRVGRELMRTQVSQQAPRFEWLAVPGHLGFASPEMILDFDAVLTVAGYSPAIVPKVQVRAGCIADPSVAAFEIGSTVRSRVFFEGIPVRSTVDFELRDLQGRIVWNGKLECGMDDQFPIEGLPEGEYELFAFWELGDRAAQGNVRVQCASGFTESTDIFLEEVLLHVLYFNLTPDDAKGGEHKLEIVGAKNGGRVLELSQKVLSGKTESFSLSTFEKLRRGRYVVNWLVDGRKKAEKQFEISAEEEFTGENLPAVVAMSFP